MAPSSKPLPFGEDFDSADVFADVVSPIIVGSAAGLATGFIILTTMLIRFGVFG